MRKVDKSRDGHINTRNINMAANAALLAVRNGPLARAGLINTGPAANRETTRFTNVHGITSIESFAQLKPDQLGAVIKAYNNGLPATMLPLGMVKQNGIAGIIWKAMDQTRRGQTITIDDFDQAAMDKGLVEYEDYKRKKEATPNMKLPKFSEDIDFDEWYSKFQAFLASQMSARYTGLDYVTRPQMEAGYDPATDAQNAHEELIQSITLHGTEFEIDNSAAFPFLQNATLNTPAWNHVETHEATRDTHAAMNDIRNHYLSEGYNHKKMASASAALKTLKYTGERHGTFEKHCNSIVKAYNIQAKQGQTYLDEFKVKFLYDSIQVSNNSAVAMSKELMIQQYKNNFKDACTYMTTRMSEIFPPGSNSNKMSRSISQSNRVSTTVNGRHIPDIFNIPDDVWYNLDRSNQNTIARLRRENGRGGRGGRGRGGNRGGRGGRGGRYHQNRDNYNNYGGRGRGSGRGGYGRGYGRNGRGGGYDNHYGRGRGQYANNGNGDGRDNRNVNETNSIQDDLNQSQAMVPYQGGNQNGYGQQQNQGPPQGPPGGRGSQNGGRFGRAGR